MDWTEKYRPSTLSEVRGNNKARDAFAEWAETWEEHREAIVLHGAPGVGKTSAAHALAADMDWPTIELNASNQRTKSVVERVAGEAAKSGTLTGGSAGRRLVIMDEADNLHGNVDRGGSRAITGLVKEASQPMVLIANEFYDMSKSLRNACETIEFRDVSARSILPVLRDICRREDVAYDDDALDAIAERNSGDLRGAVNDLQALAESAETLTVDDVVTSDRDKTTGIFDFLDALIKEEDAEGALRSSYDVDETPDDLINWIEDNVPKDYAGAELADAFDNLANADRWLGRVRATQNYSYWRYAGDAMTAGVAASRRESKGGWTRYGPPSYWSKLGRSRATRDKRDYIARKIATTSGTSMANARREIMPFLATMTHHCTNRELTVSMAARYDMDAEHVAFVTGSGEDTNKVQSIVEDATKRGEEAAVAGSEGAFEGATRTTSDESDDPDGSGESGVMDGESTAGDEDSTDEESADDPEESDDSQSGLGDFS
ncbi:replication factor C large subunit [Halococcus morrhuae DSM 1307]|uniref:Replication factor C large subunit n=1 Tax=Halococcus morrhuae DSM 1307 TaxID=931277 RepID=M0M1Z5_HALMO|nr:replication factor C large subunit [Halococcus morrhuae]EMA39418.1 replication factor C large subunit [Halococcus morrhuae DSM 1307]